MNFVSMANMKTRPAEEKDLLIENDTHGFDKHPPEGPPQLHRVLIDGKPGLAGIGSQGTYSERILLVFDEPHPEFGEEFMTKNFHFDRREPGLLHWGHEKRTFNIEIMTKEE